MAGVSLFAEVSVVLKCELFNDNFQNYKRYPIKPAQLVLADLPYNIGINAYGSSPEWYIGGNRHNGESSKAGKSFFNTDFNFNIVEYFHFCNKLLIKEPKESGKAPCMIIFCSFQQLQTVIDVAAEYGFKKYIPLVFVKNYSAQVLKANMRIVGATEYGLVLYRDKLPKFNNEGRMIFNWFLWERDSKAVPKIHPNQKPLKVLQQLIKIFTDKGDTVIDPCAGSGAALRAAYELGRSAYGFEVAKLFYRRAVTEMLADISVADDRQSVVQSLFG